MFIVTDGVERASCGLPHRRYDVPLMVSDRSFDAQQPADEPFRSRTACSDSMTGPMAPPGRRHGRRPHPRQRPFAPYLNVDTHRYRLRLLNTSPFPSYDFALSDGRPFVQIGTGNGLLPKAVVRQDILLGPAQRADVIVDFRGELGKKVVLRERPAHRRPTTGRPARRRRRSCSSG